MCFLSSCNTHSTFAPCMPSRHLPLRPLPSWAAVARVRQTRSQRATAQASRTRPSELRGRGRRLVRCVASLLQPTPARHARRDTQREGAGDAPVRPAWTWRDLFSRRDPRVGDQRPTWNGRCQGDMRCGERTARLESNASSDTHRTVQFMHVNRPCRCGHPRWSDPCSPHSLLHTSSTHTPCRNPCPAPRRTRRAVGASSNVPSPR